MENPLKLDDKCADWLSAGRIGPFGALTVLAFVYCLVQVTVMPALSAWMGTGVGIDDAEQLMYMPFLWAGYGGSQPPLFTWLLWLASSLFGSGILTLKIVKYGLYLVALLAVFAAVARAGYSRRAAAAATLGLFLFPQFVWEMQHSLSHSVAAVCLAAVLLLVFFELLRSRTTLAYLVFGLAMGAAILAKYNNIVLIGALFAAALSLQETRNAIVDPRILTSLVVALLVCSPTLYWNIAHPGEILARSHKFGLGSNGLTTRVVGLLQYGNAALNFAGLPLVVIAIALLKGPISPRAARTPPAIWEKLTFRAIAFGLGFIALLVLASGATEFRDRWLLPVLLFLPVAVAMRADAFGERGVRAQNVLICVGAALALLVLPFTWYYQVYGGARQGSIARIDYAQLYKALTADGPVRTVVSDWHWVGNLRLADSRLGTLDAEVPEFVHQLREPAVLVWLDEEKPQADILALIAKAGYVPASPPRDLAIRQIFGAGGKPRHVFAARLERHAAPAQSQ